MKVSKNVLYLRWIGVLYFGLLSIGCGENQSSQDNVPPAVVRWVAASADDVYPQQGIRADTTSSDRVYRVVLEWIRSPETDVLEGGGYRLYRTPENAPEEAHYLIADLRYGVNLNSEPIQTFVDIGDDPLGGGFNMLAPNDAGRTLGYHWEIQAYDAADNRSAISEEIYYRMLPNPTNLAVTRVQANVYNMNWHYEHVNDTYIQYWYLRVYSAYYGIDSAHYYDRVSLFGDDITVSLTPAIAQIPFVEDCTYVWQLNVVGQTATDTLHRSGRSGASMFTKFVWRD